MSEHIHTHEDSEFMEQSKYDQALGHYKLEVDETSVKRRLETILNECLQDNDTDEVKRFIFNSLELTSLSVTDTEESILKLVENVNRFDTEYPELGNVASVCVYPNFAQICHD